MKESFSILKKIELTASTISLRSDGILLFDVKPNVNVNEKDAKEMVDAAGLIGDGKKYPILIIAGKYTLADKEVRDFAAGEYGNKYTIAAAFVIKSLAQKILGNAYLKVNKPLTPTALFDSEEKAIAWLNTFIK